MSSSDVAAAAPSEHPAVWAPFLSVHRLRSLHGAAGTLHRGCAGQARQRGLRDLPSVEAGVRLTRDQRVQPPTTFSFFVCSAPSPPPFPFHLLLVALASDPLPHRERGFWNWQPLARRLSRHGLLGAAHEVVVRVRSTAGEVHVDGFVRELLDTVGATEPFTGIHMRMALSRLGVQLQSGWGYIDEAVASRLAGPGAPPPPIALSAEPPRVNGSIRDSLTLHSGLIWFDLSVLSFAF